MLCTFTSTITKVPYFKLETTLQTAVKELMESWTISHSEVILGKLITGTLTLNQTAALEQC